MPDISRTYRPRLQSPWVLSCVIHGIAIGLLSLINVPNPTAPQTFQVTLIEQAPQWHPTARSKTLALNQSHTSSNPTHSKIVTTVSLLPISVPPLQWEKDKDSLSSASPIRSARVLRDRFANRGLSIRIPVRIKDNPLPVYPQLARQAGWEGRSMLRVEVLRDGTSGMIEIKESCGHPILDQAAREAVQAWTFFPERDGMIAVRSVIDLPIRFHLAHLS